MALAIGGGINIGGGIQAGPDVQVATPPDLVLDLDAANYATVPVNGTVIAGTGAYVVTTLNPSSTMLWSALNGGIFRKTADTDTDFLTFGPDYSVTTDAYTVMMIYRSQPPSAGRLLNANSDSPDWLLGLWGNGTALQDIFFNGSFVGANNTPANDDWQFIWATYNGDPGTPVSQSYVANSTMPTTTFGTNSTTGGFNGLRLFGRYLNATTSSEVPTADVGVVKVWNGVLTLAEIQAQWTAYHARFPSATVPVLDITANSFPMNDPNGSITFNITSTGGATVLETGVIFGLPGQTTYAISVDTCTGSSSTAERTAIRDGGCPGPYTTGLTGSQTVSFNAVEFVYNNDTINVLAYAKNSAGVAYSPTVLTWTPGICLVAGTLITLADDSTKPIETIQMSDLIRVWDFDLGEFASARPLWIKQQETTTQYNLLTFSDGSTLKTIEQHRIFNKQAGAFTYPMTDDTPIGTTTINVHGQEVDLVSKCVMIDTVNYHNVITHYHLNLYADGILTSMRYNNIYPIANMKFVQDGRQLRNRSEFAGIDSRWIDGLRLPEQTMSLSDIKWYTQRLEHKEHIQHSVPASLI